MVWTPLPWLLIIGSGSQQATAVVLQSLCEFFSIIKMLKYFKSNDSIILPKSKSVNVRMLEPVFGELFAGVLDDGFVVIDAGVIFAL
jgi:hypothetical protein